MIPRQSRSSLPRSAGCEARARTRTFSKLPKSILLRLLNPITLHYDPSGRALLPDFSAMPEVFVSNANLAAAVSREVKAGTLRRIGSRLYTRNLKDPPEEIVLRNLWPLVAAHHRQSQRCL